MANKKEAQKLMTGAEKTAQGTEYSRILHDLNQPLNSIKMISGGILYLLNHGKRLSDEELAGCMKEIVSQTEEVSGIIKKFKTQV